MYTFSNIYDHYIQVVSLEPAEARAAFKALAYKAFEVSLFLFLFLVIW